MLDRASGGIEITAIPTRKPFRFISTNSSPCSCDLSVRLSFYALRKPTSPPACGSLFLLPSLHFPFTELKKSTWVQNRTQVCSNIYVKLVTPKRLHIQGFFVCGFVCCNFFLELLIGIQDTVMQPHAVIPQL